MSHRIESRRIFHFTVFSLFFLPFLFIHQPAIHSPINMHLLPFSPLFIRSTKICSSLKYLHLPPPPQPLPELIINQTAKTIPFTSKTKMRHSFSHTHIHIFQVLFWSRWRWVVVGDAILFIHKNLQNLWPPNFVSHHYFHFPPHSSAS